MPAILTSRTRAQLPVVGVTALLLICVGANAQSPVDADQPLGQLIDAYVTAWNAGDVEALGRLWADDGELINQHGVVVDRKVFLDAKRAELGDSRPRLALKVGQIRPLDPNTALVDGEAALSATDGSILERTQFSGALVKQNGAWRIRLIRELSSHESPPAEPLKDLAWMIGDWVGMGKGVRVHISSQWDMGQRFIVTRFDVEPENGELYQAAQRIGWDPETRSIKSWYYDSHGSISTGNWERDGDHWLVTIHGTQYDGESMSGTSAITPVDADSYLRTLTDARISGASVPDQELRVFRVTDEPAE